MKDSHPFRESQRSIVKPGASIELEAVKKVDKILRRIEKEAGMPDLAKAMERISPTDLQSLLIRVYRRVAEKRNPHVLLSEYVANRFTQPSSCDPSIVIEWDRLAFSHLPRSFRAIELSTVSPLGSVSSLASVSQDWVLTTIRNTEVVSDPTNVLALECAVRRQKLTRSRPADSTRVDLACRHRVLRAQRHHDQKALSHFRLFSLCSAGRDTGNMGFETTAITDHVRFYLASLTSFLGPETPLTVSLNDLSTDSIHAEHLTKLGETLEKEFHYARFKLEKPKTKTKGYYGKFRFHIHAAQKEEQVELVDGGDTDWTQKLLNNAKERLVTSAIGSERLCERFGSLNRAVSSI